MIARQVARSRFLKPGGWVLLFLALAFGTPPATAQIVGTLLQFTNVWKYDQSGLELGAAWRTNDFDDAAWPSGRGLLGLDQPLPSAYLNHAVINTPLTISSAVTTFYFRTSFEFTGSMIGVSLVSSNLVDDGCVIYLNGLRAGAVRAPAIYNASTVFAGPATEGLLDVVILTNLNALRQGENLVAVEVHQTASTSPDVMWGMKLMSIQQTPLTITNQPQSQTVLVGEQVVLGVGVSGGPAFYRWLKDGTAIPNATNASYSISAASLDSSGQYRVIITNALSSLTSSAATLAVLPDAAGPRMVAAIWNNTAPGGGAPFGSNTINVQFSEPVTPSTVRDTNNFTVKRIGGTSAIPVLSVLYSTALGALLNTDDTDPDWAFEGDYVLTVNNVRDLRGNVIAPDSQIAVARRFLTNLVSANSTWSSHSTYSADPTVYDQPWQTMNFVEGPFWVPGVAPFCGGALPNPPCPGDCETVAAYQLSPTLFRTTFLRPEQFPASTLLFLNGAADDGLVLFLNGVEIWRTNAVGNRTPISVTSYATTGRRDPLCFSNVNVAVTNLVPGTNLLAAALVQPLVATEFDSAFALAVTGQAFRVPPLPEEPAPQLELALLDTRSVLLSWTGYGYTLESATNLSLGSASYPLGPWLQVSNLSNPFTNGLSEPARFFRLKK